MQTDSKKTLLNWLVAQFECKRVSKTSNKYTTWQYTICPIVSYLNGSRNVCKTAYMAVMDIRESLIDQAQDKIRKEIKHETLIDKDEGQTVDRFNLSLEECFDYFELDYQKYYNNLHCFVNFNAIPETNTGLIATAFLVDYFQICGEQEVCLIRYYYLILYSQIYKRSTWTILRKKRFTKYT